MSLSKHLHLCVSKSYNLFVSFRGNLRDTFVSHLSHYFEEANINAFVDRKEIKLGEEINSKIREAIENSPIYVPIFSKEYASSYCCLLEIKEMMAAVQKSEGKTILPVFYDVEVEDVKLQTSLYHNHLERHNVAPATVELWKEALRFATRYRGLLLTKCPNGEADLCKEIVQGVQALIMAKERSVALRINIRHCKKLTSLEGLEFGSKTPTFLTIEDCWALENVLNGQSRILLKGLKIINCYTLAEVRFPEEMDSLEELIIENCPSLDRLNVSKLIKLGKLWITNCENLTEIQGLEELVSSESLTGDHLMLTSPEDLVIENCSNLRCSVTGIHNCLSLGHITCHGCPPVPLPDIRKMKGPDTTAVNVSDTSPRLSGSSDRRLEYLPDEESETFIPGLTESPCSSLAIHSAAEAGINKPAGASFEGVSSSLSTFPRDTELDAKEQAIFEQLDNLDSLLIAEGSSTETITEAKPSLINTGEAKAVMMSFFSGGMEALGGSIDLTTLRTAANTLSGADPTSRDFWEDFPSKVHSTSVIYKQVLQHRKAAETARAEHTEAVRSAMDSKSRYLSARARAEEIKKSNEALKFEMRALKAQLALLEEQVTEADHELQFVRRECLMALFEVDKNVKLAEATRGNKQTKDAELADSEEYLFPEVVSRWNKLAAHRD